MLYPQNGSMANGSRRILPTFKSSAAAVISEPTIEPRNTPWFQSRDWCTSGIVLGRRPPNRNAEIGTPLGSSHSSAIAGHCLAGAVKRAFGCAFRAFIRRQRIAGITFPVHQFSLCRMSDLFPPYISVFRQCAVGKDGVFFY